MRPELPKICSEYQRNEFRTWEIEAELAMKAEKKDKKERKPKCTP